MTGVMTSLILPRKYPRNLVPLSNVGTQSMIFSTTLLEDQALLKCRSLVDMCLTVDLELDLKVSPLSWKDTLGHCLNMPQRIAQIQRSITWLHFYHNLTHFTTKVEGGWTNRLLFELKAESSILLQDIFGFVRNDQEIVNIKKHTFMVIFYVCTGGNTHPYISINQAWLKSQVLNTASQVIPEIMAYNFPPIYFPNYHCSFYLMFQSKFNSTYYKVILLRRNF